VHKRFLRQKRNGARNGVWQMVFNTLAVTADTEWLMLDSTIVRAHHCAAGAKKQRRTRPLSVNRLVVKAGLAQKC
jgi:hypothetical protein